MTIICMHCKPCIKYRPPRDAPRAPRSRVVETRVASGETRVRGKRESTLTVRRIRQCPQCKFRWHTVETVVPSSRVRRPS